MTRHSSAAPLVSLDAVVFDTETTGPDAATARLVQIGAVRLAHGEIAVGETFETLVDPGKPIPASSTRVHGIGDADVAGSPGFAAAHAAFRKFVGEAVVIGHSIGFDLAILKRECMKAGLEWRQPRSLDTNLLARVARPALSDFSLDTVAGLLGIEIENRHTALGDALATARIFRALVPLLREQHVRTLAEAEAATRALTHELMKGHAAGWVEPVAPRPPENARALARIDSYPYRHRVKDIMGSPPLFAEADWTLERTIGELVKRKVSSLFVRSPRGETGIVTERDILRAMSGKGADGLALAAGDIMSKPLRSVPADAFLYHAIARMDRLNFRHLAVVDEAGEIVGALTTRDLLHQRASAALVLGDEIAFAASVPALGAAWARLPHVAEQLLGEGVDGRDIAAVVSAELCAVTRRAGELAEARMAEAGRGPPPVAYALMVLGSGGRGESLLAADQDNAIVYAGAEEEGAADRWFADMAAHMAEILDTVGVADCKGGVMARNRGWRHTVSGWKRVIDDWIRRSKPEDLLNVDIFYDLRPVHGDAALAEEIRAYAFERGSRAPEFAKLLAETAGDFRPPIGPFWRLQTENGRLDLKRGGLFPLVTAARVLAIRHDVRERATPARLAGLSALGIGSQAEFAALEEAHRLLLGHILEQQIEDIHAGQRLSNGIVVKRLSRARLRALKQALHGLAHLDRMVHDLLFEKPRREVQGT